MNASQSKWTKGELTMVKVKRSGLAVFPLTLIGHHFFILKKSHHMIHCVKGNFKPFSNLQTELKNYFL